MSISNQIAVDGTHKAAALLLAMGKPLADRLLKHFSDNELRRLVETTASLGTIARAEVETLVDEMAAAFERGADLLVATDAVETMLAGVVPAEQIASLVASLKGEQRPSVWPRLSDVAETRLHEFLSVQHPQIAAFALAKCGAGVAAGILERFEAAQRAEIIRRMLAMQPVSDAAEAIAAGAIEDGLLAAAGNNPTTPVHARIADIINKMERRQIDELLTDLDERRPKDADLVRGRLFAFDDIARLSAADRVKLLDGIPADRLVLALHGAGADLTELMLAAVSQRSRRMIEQELAAGVTPPRPDVAKARRAIADLALTLAEQGQISIASPAVG